MNLKTGIVVLVLLALCFFAGVGNGLLRTNDTSTPPPGASTPTNPPWADSIDKLFPRGIVTFNDVSSSNNSCLDPKTQRLTVPALTSCEYTLPPATLPKKIFLCLSSGTSALVTTFQPGDGDATPPPTPAPLTKKTLGTGTSMEFRAPIRQSANNTNQLSIFCQDLATPCSLRILQTLDEQCP